MAQRVKDPVLSPQQLGSLCGTGLIPGPGTSACRGCGQNTKKSELYLKSYIKINSRSISELKKSHFYSIKRKHRRNFHSVMGWEAFFFLFRAESVVYGSSWARGRIGAAAAS